MTQQEFLDYIIDKFNLTMDLSGSQIEQFVEQLFAKIITWELVTSILTIIAWVLIISIAGAYVYKSNKQENMFKYLVKYWKKENITDEEYRKFSRYFLTIVIYAIINVIAIIVFIYNTTTIIQCLVFPEKIVLEFLSNYI